MVLPLAFSWLRTRRMAFAASVASSRLPCVGDDDQVGAADRVADHERPGPF
jgi:hypothetical protein